MGLYTVGAADHKDRRVQNGHDPFRLRGKVHMPRCVHQRQIQLLRRNKGLLGKDRDATLPLQAVGIQKSITVIHPTQLPPGTAAVQQGLGKGGLARVHMGQQADTDALFQFLSHAVASFFCNWSHYSMKNPFRR